MPRSMKLTWSSCTQEEFTWYESDEFEGRVFHHPLTGIRYSISIKKQEYINDFPVGDSQLKTYKFYLKDDTPLEPHQLTIANLTERCKKYYEKYKISSWY